MDVILSWSKKQSQTAARVFREWLPKVLPGIKPWHSKYDIEKGTRWFDELQKYLDGAKACIVFITPENAMSPWLYWETGAISSTKGDKKQGEQGPRIFPVLINVGTYDISDTPLSLYQASLATKDDLLLMIETLNDSLVTPLDELRLRGLFEKHWEELERQLEKIKEIGISPQIVNLVKGLRKLEQRFNREWDAAHSTSNAAVNDFIEELRAELTRLTAKIGDREKHFTKELENELYSLRSNRPSYTPTGVENLKQLFPEVISKILAKYE